MDSAKIWKAHTSTNTFAEKFDQISEEYKNENDIRASKIEQFIIAEAKVAGVIKSSRDKQQKNPNRWSKHLAPWFDESCREDKKEYKIKKRRHGKMHAETKIAYAKFKESCRK